ncbi:hypothetical protein VFPBJ_03960 [Purpureocillium lilacinum]|uniref:Uncharacterized protein n=1 Tax=Purpureocillium lilacinum TaxID=33203 RepID=A0A179GTU4_PURLI|nr:hypothetical protein VFPBJ_03960 [Purpureocillium lilacinum]
MRAPNMEVTSQRPVADEPRLFDGRGEARGRGRRGMRWVISTGRDPWRGNNPVASAGDAGNGAIPTAPAGSNLQCEMSLSCGGLRSRHVVTSSPGACVLSSLWPTGRG